MNFEDMKKTGTNEIIVSDSLLAPLLQFKLTVDTNTTIPEENTLEIYVDDSSDGMANRKSIVFLLASPLYSLENVSDSFIVEPLFLGNKISMKAYVRRKILATLQENAIVIGEDLSGKTLVLNFPDVLGTNANYYSGLFSSAKYRVRESFSNQVNSIVLENIETLEVVETLYSNVGSDVATINLTSFVLPDDFGVITNVIEENNPFADALQYIKYNSLSLSVREEDLIEELNYQPVVLYEGYNKISANYTNANLNIVYPKNSDLTKYFLTNTYTYGLNNEDKFLTLDDIYFKDCFTEVEPDTINADFNKLTIKCMNSANNNFSLDCEGNLVVNSITTKVKGEESSNIDFDSIYPVGSIYLSVNSANPSTLFGGTWEAFASGRTLVGFHANEEEFNIVGKTGGSKTVALTVEEMPSHKHRLETEFNEGEQIVAMCEVAKNDGYNIFVCESANDTRYRRVQTVNRNTTTVGSGQAHNNLQPYIVVYMWKRVA